MPSPPATVFALPVAMVESALVGSLVSTIGLAPLTVPRLLPAGLPAVPLAAVAPSAHPEDHAADATSPLQKDQLLGRHPVVEDVQGPRGPSAPESRGHSSYGGRRSHVARLGPRPSTHSSRRLT
jgi:hypothetical protein